MGRNYFRAVELAGICALIVLASGPRAFAADKASTCVEVKDSVIRLDVPGGTMEKIQPRIQGDVSLCYAHVAAEMVDAWRLSHEIPQDYAESPEAMKKYLDARTSEIYAALDYASTRKEIEDCKNSGGSLGEEKFFERGKVCSAVEQIANSGACDQRAVEDSLKKQAEEQADYVELKGKRPSRKASSVRDLLKHFYGAEHRDRFCKEAQGNSGEKPCKRRSWLPVDGDVFLLYLGVDEIVTLQSRMSEGEKQRFNDPEIGRLLRPVFEARSYLDFNSEAACYWEKRIQFKTGSKSPFSCGIVDRGGRDTQFMISGVLGRLKSSKSQPIGINYCANVLVEKASMPESGGPTRNREFAGEKPGGEKPGGEKPGGEKPGGEKPGGGRSWLTSNACKMHSSVLIGRRMCADGRTQLLIRNTWDKSAKYNKRWEVEAGGANIWVDADALGKNLDTFYQLTDSPVQE